jgi:phosphatidylglycerophosphate synthase
MFSPVWAALLVVGLVLLFVLIAMPDTQRARERKRERAEKKRRMAWSQRIVAVLVGMAVTGIVGRLYEKHVLSVADWIWVLLVTVAIYGGIAYLIYRRRRDRKEEREQAHG